MSDKTFSRESVSGTNEINSLQRLTYDYLLDSYRHEAMMKPNSPFGFVKITFSILKSLQPKCFLFDAFCIGAVIEGELRIICNKVEYSFDKGTVFYNFAGTVVEIQSASDNFEMLFMFSNEQIKLNVISLTEQHHIESFFTFQSILKLSEANLELFTSSLKLLKKVVINENHSSQIIVGICVLMLHLFNNMPEKRVYKREIAKYNFQTMIYRQFLKLLHEYCPKERSVSFYADKLCVTQRSLSNIVKEFSGISAKDWIDQSVIQRAKVLLGYSTKSIMEISEELNFSTLSAFTIYFKRITQLTPLEFRKQVN